MAQSAMTVQRYVRGWLTRKRMQQMRKDWELRQKEERRKHSSTEENGERRIILDLNTQNRKRNVFVVSLIFSESRHATAGEKSYG